MTRIDDSFAIGVLAHIPETRRGSFDLLKKSQFHIRCDDDVVRADTCLAHGRYLNRSWVAEGKNRYPSPDCDFCRLLDVRV